MGDVIDDRRLLYIAGPYTIDPVRCTQAAIRTATEVYIEGEYIPVVPHLTMFWHLVTPMSYREWLTIDFAVLARCEAIMRLPGPSQGADMEMVVAVGHTLDVVAFTSMTDEVREPWLSLMREEGWPGCDDN